MIVDHWTNYQTDERTNDITVVQTILIKVQCIFSSYLVLLLYDFITIQMLSKNKKY